MNQIEQELRIMLKETEEILFTSGPEQVRQAARNLIEGELTKVFGLKLSQALNTSEMDNEEWLGVMNRACTFVSTGFIKDNKYDNDFYNLITHILITKKEDLLDNLKKRYETLEDVNKKSIDNYFNKYHFWGGMDVNNNNWEAFENRVNTLKHHALDFAWLYSKLADYESKHTLYAVLTNWLELDCYTITLVKSKHEDYFEPDIFRHNKDDVFVDLGAYTGDTIKSYLSTYGQAYKKIFAYEISADSFEELCKTSKICHDIFPIRKGVGDHADWLALDENESSSSANTLKADGRGEKVELVTLDDDIKEPVTFIKMDIEGAEYGALCGAKQHIINEKPKLAVCVYHGYDDLWRLPALIESFRDDYLFYLRHNGGNLIPTEFVLLCK